MRGFRESAGRLKARVAAGAPAFSLVVVEENARLVFLLYRSGAPALLQAAAEYPCACVTVESLGAALQDFSRRYRLEIKSIIFCPPLSCFTVKRLELTALPEQELAQALRWRLKTEVSVDLSKTVLSWQVLSRRQRESGEPLMDILCILAPETVLCERIRLFERCGYAVREVAFLPRGMAAVLRERVPSGCVAALLVSWEETALIFAAEGKLRYYRQLPVSFAKLREAVQDTVVTQAGKVSLDAREADELLAQFGVPVGSFVFKDKMSSSQVLALLRPHLERLVQEVNRSSAYYEQELHESQPKELVLGSGAGLLKNLDIYLKRELGMPVSVFARSDASSVPVELRGFAEAAGGLFQDPQRGGSLLPAQLRTNDFEKTQRLSLLWGAAALAGVLVTASLFLQAGGRVRERQLLALRAQMKDFSALSRVYTQTQGLAGFVETVRAGEADTYVLLRALSALVPAELSFSRFSLDGNEKKARIEGTVKPASQEPGVVVAGFIKALKESGVVREATIDSLQQEGAQQEAHTVFRLSVTLP